MRTYINDSFNLDLLECQYFDICNHYVPDDCDFDSSCPIRQNLRNMLEDYVEIDTLHLQIMEIVHETQE